VNAVGHGERKLDYTTLDDDQKRRFGELVDSRVRLLGEYYGRAVEQLQHDPSPENERWILEGK